jgi:hypothetical protein
MRLPIVHALISFISEMAITLGKQFEQGSVTITAQLVRLLVAMS